MLRRYSGIRLEELWANKQDICQYNRHPGPRFDRRTSLKEARGITALANLYGLIQQISYAMNNKKNKMMMMMMSH